MNEGAHRSIVSVTPAAVGSDSRTYKIAASFVRAGYQSTVVEGHASRLGQAPPFELRTVRTRHVSQSSGRPSKVVQVLRRDFLDVLRATPRADLYYLHSHQPYPGVAWRRRRFHAALVYDAHDFYDELMHPGLGSAAKRYWQRRAIRSAAAFVTVSEGVADLYEQAYGRRPTVIRNAHDSRIESAVVTGLRARTDVAQDARVFAVVGDAKPHMALENVVDAIEALPDDVHVAFVGRGYHDRLAGHIPQSLASRVHLMGAVETTEVVPFIASADAALMPYVATAPNTRYSLQNGFFQSVAAGLPLLVPEDLPELRMSAGSAGVAVDFSDTGSIIAGARHLLEDNAGPGVARAAVATLRTELTWEREEAKLLELVATALDARR